MNNTHPDRVDLLAPFGGFDADWYLAQYPDVAIMGMDAKVHFLWVGHRIGRGFNAKWPSLGSLPELANALSRKPVVSYCIPVMDRLSDLQMTLADNLAEHRAMADSVEFVVAVFEDEQDTETWVRDMFADDLASGFLRLICLPRLPIWHFGRAKNVFRGRIAGQIYSSLDGDNFVSAAETRQLLDLLRRQGETLVFHHFSGHWGDGSSGRVSLPARVYEEVGYDEHLLPRQFDEVDLILSALVAHPQLVLAQYATQESVLQADSVRGYLRSLAREITVTRHPEPSRRAPVNPKSDGYAGEDPALTAMQAMNEALSFLKNAPGATRRSEWVGRLRRGAEDWVKLSDAEVLRLAIFGAVDIPVLDAVEITCLLPGGSGALSDMHPKFIIDSRSSPMPAGSTSDGDFVLHPLVGDALVADVLWRAALTKISAS